MCFSYFFMISTVLSVLPPSRIMNSIWGYCWEITDSIVCSINGPWLKEGVITEILGSVITSASYLHRDVQPNPPRRLLSGDPVKNGSTETASETRFLLLQW